MRSLPFRVALVSGIALAVLSLGLRGPAPAAAATPCWQRVIADWSADGSIQGSYPGSCYRQAMQNAPTDLRIYSTLENDLQRALTLRLRSSRRLAVAPAPATSLRGAGGSSATPFLVALIAGLATAVAACSVAAAVIRRRAGR